jgi:hypothetical protein
VEPIRQSVHITGADGPSTTQEDMTMSNKDTTVNRTIDGDTAEGHLVNLRLQQETEDRAATRTQRQRAQHGASDRREALDDEAEGHVRKI